jgi:hypothetical protein
MCEHPGCDAGWALGADDPPAAQAGAAGFGGGWPPEGVVLHVVGVVAVSRRVPVARQDDAVGGDGLDRACGGSLARRFTH